MVALLTTFTVLLYGCGNGVNADIIIEEKDSLQQSKKQETVLVTIEEEEVPLAATLQPADETYEQEAPAIETEADVQNAETAETWEEEEAVTVKPMPTQEVEVSLQEDSRMEVSVETEGETTSSPVFDSVAFSAMVQQAVNEARASAGLPALSSTAELSAAAACRAVEIAESFSHTRPSGADYSTAVSEAGGSFGCIGENLFYGMQSVAAVQNAWNSSEIHLENIMNSSFNHIGVGVAETPDGVCVVQIFTD